MVGGGLDPAHMPTSVVRESACWVGCPHRERKQLLIQFSQAAWHRGDQSTFTARGSAVLGERQIWGGQFGGRVVIFEVWALWKFFWKCCKTNSVGDKQPSAPGKNVPPRAGAKIPHQKDSKKEVRAIHTFFGRS